MPTAEVNGQTLYYEDHGEGDPLLCVMGLAANTLSWALCVPAFAEQHRAVIFDNRDVGQSSMANSPYEIADMGADTLALADALELETFHLLGVSMGGAISQEAALAAPERIKTLTLAVTFGYGGPAARHLARVWSAVRHKQSREEHVDELIFRVVSEDFFQNEGAVDYLRTMMLADPNPQPPEAFVRQLEASSRHDTRDRLGSLEMPVHVIGAERDFLVPIWKSQEVADLIPDCRHTIMERAPHGVTLERADEFSRLVLDFIAEHSAARV